MNNSVVENGLLIGFRCYECQEVKPNMWGEMCNVCREKERRHMETIKCSTELAGANLAIADYKRAQADLQSLNESQSATISTLQRQLAEAKEQIAACEGDARRWVEFRKLWAAGKDWRFYHDFADCKTDAECDSAIDAHLSADKGEG